MGVSLPSSSTNWYQSRSMSSANAPLMPSNAQEPNDVLPIEEALAALALADTQASLSSYTSTLNSCLADMF